MSPPAAATSLLGMRVELVTRNSRVRKAKKIYRLCILCTQQQIGTSCVLVLDIQANGVLKNEKS
jgi:hypothetical protein